MTDERREIDLSIKQRINSPLFIVGDVRSGTTLTYRLLLSCPEFPNYRAETHLLDEWPARFGSLSKDASFDKFIEAWKRSKQFERSGLSAQQLSTVWDNAPRRYVSLLGRFMQAVAENQDKRRWVEKTPAHVRYIGDFNQEYPDARFLHVIRDPRDVAVSREKLGWMPEVSGEHARVLATCLEWRSMIIAARRHAEKLRDRYMEVRYEDLIRSPRVTFARICQFADVPINLEALSQVRGSNSAFKYEEGTANDGCLHRKALRRWETSLKPAELRAIDLAVGPTISAMGYESSNVDAPRLRESLKLRAQIARLSGREWLRGWIKYRASLPSLAKAGLC